MTDNKYNRRLDSPVSPGQGGTGPGSSVLVLFKNWTEMLLISSSNLSNLLRLTRCQIISRNSNTNSHCGDTQCLWDPLTIPLQINVYVIYVPAIEFALEFLELHTLSYHWLSMSHYRKIICCLMWIINKSSTEFMVLVWVLYNCINVTEVPGIVLWIAASQ